MANGFPIQSTVREVSGKSPGNFWGSARKFWEVQGLSRSSGEPDSSQATRQNCLQGLEQIVISLAGKCRNVQTAESPRPSAWPNGLMVVVPEPKKLVNI